MTEEMQLSDGGRICYELNEDGSIPPCEYWTSDKDFILDIQKLLKEYDAIIPKKGNESAKHHLLKKAALLYIQSIWGLDANDTCIEFIDNSCDLSIRPDMVVGVPHKNFKAAFEVGDLSYRNKIKDLLTEFGYDYVVWVPHYPNKQLHYLSDVQFFCDIRNSTIDLFAHEYAYSGGLTNLCVGKCSGKNYVLSYSALSKDYPRIPISFYIYYKKSVGEMKNDVDTFNRIMKEGI